MSHSIVIVADRSAGEIKAPTYELAEFARALGADLQDNTIVVALGAHGEEAARSVAESIGIDAIALECDGISEYDTEAYMRILGDLLAEMRPTHVCFSAGSQGSEMAPGLAVRLGAACVSNVETIIADGEDVLFGCSTFGGKIVSHVAVEAEMCVVSVQRGAFPPYDGTAERPGSVKVKTVDAPTTRSTTTAIKPAEPTDSDLVNADVVISAGRGIGKRENLELLSRLAELFPRSSLAGSRPVCDLGWLDYRRQVGLTGATVRPKVYIACGISGSVQHTAGMRGAEFIVAINTDPDAAIFNIADVCVVEDVVSFVGALIDEG